MPYGRRHRKALAKSEWVLNHSDWCLTRSRLCQYFDFRKGFLVRMGRNYCYSQLNDFLVLSDCGPS